MKQDKHAHHWTIESPAGESRVSGQCTHCGEERSFPVSIDIDVPKATGVLGERRK